MQIQILKRSVISKAKKLKLLIELTGLVCDTGSTNKHLDTAAGDLHYLCSPNLSYSYRNVKMNGEKLQSKQNPTLTKYHFFTNLPA